MNIIDIKTKMQKKLLWSNWQSVGWIASYLCASLWQQITLCFSIIVTHFHFLSEARQGWKTVPLHVRFLLQYQPRVTSVVKGPSSSLVWLILGHLQGRKGLGGYRLPPAENACLRNASATSPPNFKILESSCTLSLNISIYNNQHVPGGE